MLSVWTELAVHPADPGHARPEEFAFFAASSEGKYDFVKAFRKWPHCWLYAATAQRRARSRQASIGMAVQRRRSADGAGIVLTRAGFGALSRR